MSESPKINGGNNSGKAEMLYEMSEMLSLDNVYLAAKAKEKTKTNRVDMSTMQEIKIPELNMVVYAKKEKDPNIIRNKYVKHARAMHLKMNPIQPEAKTKEQPKKTKDDTNGNALKA